MLALDEQQQSARDWFESLRDRICAANSRRSSARREATRLSTFTPWDRTDPDGAPGGGGVRGQMNGRVFEKVGVNVSTVGGRFSPEFAASIHGAQDDPSFFATGISLVAHMANPHVPAVHMNTRFLATTKRWFGGGADLNPAIPNDEDTEAFHARLRAACAAHDPTFYPRFSKWAEDYFQIPHRGVPRGVGGIFYDHLECAEPGEGPTSRTISPSRATWAKPSSTSSRRSSGAGATRRSTTRTCDRLLEFRGRYVEFNLLYDRGTLFGLKTGGNIDAILMSLPPLAAWK